jgi:hypothetical protein
MPPTGDMPMASRSPSSQSVASSASSQPLPVTTCNSTSLPTTPSVFNCANVSRACDAQLLEDGVLGTQPDLGRIRRAAISQRTRDALAAERARGERLGAAPALPMQITRRIIAECGNGRTFQAITEGLMADGIPTARG